MFSFGNKPTAKSGAHSAPSVSIGDNSGGGGGGGSGGGAQDDVQTHTETKGVQRAVPEDEDVTHEVRCRLFRWKKEPAPGWSDLGVAPVRLQRHKDTKRSRLVFVNGAGRTLLNAAVFSELKVGAKDKNYVDMTCVEVDPADASKQVFTKYLIKVKGAELRDSLLAALNKAKADAK